MGILKRVFRMVTVAVFTTMLFGFSHVSAEEKCWLEPDLHGQVKLKSADSAWDKPVDYEADINGNLVIRSTRDSNDKKDKGDSDSVYLGCLDIKKKFKRLIVEIIDVNGKSPWGKKLFGMYVNDRMYAPWDIAKVRFEPPAGESIDHNYIKNQSIGDSYSYDISKLKKRVVLGMKTVVYQGLSYTISVRVK